MPINILNNRQMKYIKSCDYGVWYTDVKIKYDVNEAGCDMRSYR